MTFIVDGLLAMAVIAMFFGLLFYKVGHNADERETLRKKRASRERAEKVEFDQRRYRPGEPLICLNCEPPFRFEGPLTETGCPRCHQQTLVETLEEFRRAQEKYMRN